MKCKRTTIDWEIDLYKKIKEYQDKKYINSFSQALKDLVIVGLKETSYR